MIGWLHQICRTPILLIQRTGILRPNYSKLGLNVTDMATPIIRLHIVPPICGNLAMMQGMWQQS